MWLILKLGHNTLCFWCIHILIHTSKTFHHSRSRWTVSPQFFLPPACILCLWICLFWVFHITGITHCVIFYICFHLASCFEGTSTLYIYEYSIPFNGWIIFHCVCIPQFISHPLVDFCGQFVETFWRVLLWICTGVPVFNLLSIHLGEELWGHMFHFLRNCQTVFYSGWTILYSLQHLLLASFLFDYSFPILIFLMTSAVEHLFIFVEMSIYVLYPVFNWVVFLL